MQEAPRRVTHCAQVPPRGILSMWAASIPAGLLLRGPSCVAGAATSHDAEEKISETNEAIARQNGSSSCSR